MKKTTWLVPAGLILLSVIPLVGAGIRIGAIAAGSVTPEDVRFIIYPWPVVVHIVSVSIYSLLGAFQFSPGVRNAKPGWHRTSGRILVPAGLLVALTGLWMTEFYPRFGFDGPAVYVMRLLVGISMTVFMCLGIKAIVDRKFNLHGEWMIRAYAIAMGAGTQVLTHVPVFLFPSLQSELSRALCMGLGWFINIVVAEWIIYKGKK